MRDLFVADRLDSERPGKGEDVVVIGPGDLVELFGAAQQLTHPPAVGVVEGLGLLELREAAPHLALVEPDPLIVAEFVVQLAILGAQRQRQMLDDLGTLVVPHAEEAGLHEGPADRARHPVLPPGPRVGEEALEIGKAPPGAGARGHDVPIDAEVAAELMLDGLAEVANLAVPLPSLDQLLRAKRDQHAEYVDPNLTGERAPAVHRLGQTEAHGDPPSRATLSRLCDQWFATCREIPTVGEIDNLEE